MDHGYYLPSGLAVLIFSVCYLLFDKWFLRVFKIKVAAISYDSAKSALDRLGSWVTWITGLQTAAIAAMGFLIKENTHRCGLETYGFFALLFFGSSIILSTWLLSSLPSIQQSLVKSDSPNIENDIYMKNIFSFVPIRMGRFSGLVHSYFLVGIVFFALFVFQIFSQE